MLPKKLPAKVVVQNVGTKILCEEAFQKTSLEMPALKCCPKKSARTVVQIVLTELLAEKTSEKATSKTTFLKGCSKLYPQEQWLKRSVREF